MKLEEIKAKIPIKPFHEEDAGVIYCADCLEVMKYMPDKCVDLVLTDPTYGINMDKGFSGAVGFKGKGQPIPRRQHNDEWDFQRPCKGLFEVMDDRTKDMIVFGGNFFADILPQGTHWLVWDKLNTMPTFSDCELIWTNIKRKSVMKITHEYNGLIGKENIRWHPTQKPKELLAKILNDYSKENMIILDPFLGSGTTAVSCKQLNRKFIGIEISEKYCEIAVRRLAQEYLF